MKACVNFTFSAVVRAWQYARDSSVRRMPDCITKMYLAHPSSPGLEDRHGREHTSRCAHFRGGEGKSVTRRRSIHSRAQVALGSVRIEAGTGRTASRKCAARV